MWEWVNRQWWIQSRVNQEASIAREVINTDHPIVNEQPQELL